MALLKGRTRRWIQRVHLWSGLGLGLLWALLGLTGSALVYYVELDRWLHPLPTTPALTRPAIADRLQGGPQWQPILDALERAHPHRPNGWRVELPESEMERVTARYLRPEETAGQMFAPLLVDIDWRHPDIQAARLWGSTPMTWIYDLHYTLLTGERGLWLVGVGVGLLALGCLLGLFLWWPARGGWKQASRLRWNAPSVRRLYDLHKLSGWLGMLVLPLLALTGLALALPQVAAPVWSLAGGRSPLPVVALPRPSEGPWMTLDAVLQTAEAALPGTRARWVDTPAAHSAVWRVRLSRPEDPSQRFPHRYVWISGVDGTVLAQHGDGSRTGHDSILAWLHPLHNGEALGSGGRVAVALAGLLPLALLWSGGRRWWLRRKHQRTH